MNVATSNDWREQVIEDIKAASIQPPMTKAEMVLYYQKLYPGTGAAGWKQHLIKDLLPFTPQTGKNPAKNLAKRFDPQRLGNPEPRNAAQYKALGAKIGRKPPKYGYHLEFSGWLRFSNVCAYRGGKTVDITGEWAAQVAADPSLAVRAMLLIYLEEDDQEKDIDEQSPSVGFCEEGETGEEGEDVEDPEISVYANVREVPSGHSGRERRFSFFAR